MINNLSTNLNLSNVCKGMFHGKMLTQLGAITSVSLHIHSELELLTFAISTLYNEVMTTQWTALSCQYGSPVSDGCEMIESSELPLICPTTKTEKCKV